MTNAMVAEHDLCERSVLAERERIRAILMPLADPTPKMLEAFQAAFAKQLKIRKFRKKGYELSAEQAGIKALLGVLVDDLIKEGVLEA